MNQYPELKSGTQVCKQKMLRSEQSTEPTEKLPI